LASNDPEFERKAADILGLYLNPPQHAAVFCVDEKTAIQALDRLDPVLPLSPGRAERHGFEYYRHGTLPLYAALDTQTGRVHGKTAARHTSRDFVAFLEEVVSLCPPRQQIHIILDNLAAHNTQRVRDFLQRHPLVQFHFTPTYSSWLNQVEIWFAKIEREVIARAASSPRSPIWLASFAATSTSTQPTLAQSSGNTPTLLAAYVLTNSLRQSMPKHRKSDRWTSRKTKNRNKTRYRLIFP
jgi:transposase